jgi:hypothetical protein
MSKEKNVLSTVNHVVKHIQDKAIVKKSFKDTSIDEIVKNFFMVWPDIIKDFNNVKTPEEFYRAFIKDDRVIYYGIMLIIVALLLFFLQSSTTKI